MSGTSDSRLEGGAAASDERRERFADWLRERVAADVEIAAWDAPEWVGHSNETILVEARVRSPRAIDSSHAPTPSAPSARSVTHAMQLPADFRIGGPPDTLSLVVRVQAEAPAVFPHYDLSQQCACMRGVGAESDVPVPSVRWFDPATTIFGRPFYVMDRIEGLVPADRMPYTMSGWLYDATPAEQKILFESSLDVLADIHRIDWRRAGLALLDRPEHGTAGLEQQIAWWLSMCDWIRAERPQPTIDAATAWLRAHVPSPSGPIVLNWGDARLSNIMYRDFRPVAVLDWEMATLGPAEVDLGWFLFFQRFFADGLGVPDLPGFLARDAAIAHYEQRLGRKMDDLFFYEVFAAWRNATVMLRIADIYETRGLLSADSGAGQNNVATRLLARMLDLPSPGEPGGPFG